jgi:hypothetical protein
MASKNPKKPSQKPKSTRTQICFFTNFKGKKTPNMNFPNQMKLFDTNIVGCLNQRQQHFSLSITGIRQPLSLLFQSGTKKIIKKNFYIKIKLKKY